MDHTCQQTPSILENHWLHFYRKAEVNANHKFSEQLAQTKKIVQHMTVSSKMNTKL